MIIERDLYLKKLIAKRHDGKIKIITDTLLGIRETGKRIMLLGREKK